MKKTIAKLLSLLMISLILLSGCSSAPKQDAEPAPSENPAETETASDVRLQPDWAKDAVIYEVNVRQFTEAGTFNAFSEHLQELKDMGINTLWFMPIHPISFKNRAGKMGSPYSVADYCKVNPDYGSMEAFDNLVKKAHDMGFHVMLDWVANHTGWDNPWIEEHPDWYTQDDKGNIISPDGWPDVADLNYDNADMRQEMISSMVFWVKEHDVDGFRCDYANGAPVSFWEDARDQLEAVKPVYMLAECEGIKEFLVKGFDTEYNWHLYDTLAYTSTGGGKASSIKNYVSPNYLPDGAYQMNFLDNHDKNAYEGAIGTHYTSENLPTFFAIIYTIPGVPMIYTGDEIALEHSLEFMERDPVDWNSTGVSYREELAALAKIRKENPALYSGNYGGAIEYVNVGENDKYIFTFTREKDGNKVKCLFNCTNKEREVDLSSWLTDNETVLMHGIAEELNWEEYPIADDGLETTATLAPWEFYIVRD